MKSPTSGMFPSWLVLTAYIVWALLLTPVVLVVGVFLAIFEGWKLALRYFRES